MCHSCEQDQLSPSRTDHPPCVSHSPINNPSHGNGTSSLPSNNPTSPSPLPSSSVFDANSQPLNVAVAIVDDNDDDNNLNNNSNNNNSLSVAVVVEPSSSSSAQNPLLCTICVDLTTSPADVVTIPSCGHSFCLSCLASWFQVRNLCPNCKCLFSEVLCSRDVDTGIILPGPITKDGQYARNIIALSDLMICPPTWLKTQLTPVHSAQHDIEHAFEMLPTETQMSYQDLMAMQQEFENMASSLSSSSTSTIIPAPAYACEEIEDELEDQFWQEEERVHQSLMRNSRTISNRRYGNSGYLAAGRMHARPSSSSSNNNRNNNNASSSSTSSSGVPGSSAAHAKKNKKKNKKHNNSKENNPIQDKRPENIASNRTGITTSCRALHQSGQVHQRDSDNWSGCVGGDETGEGGCGNGEQKRGGRKKKVKKKSRAGIAAAKAAAESARASSSALTQAQQGNAA